jgi:dihydrofolate synthase / folylpolyglutamate synthase
MAARSFSDWLEYQNQVHSLSMDFSLERIRAVWQRAGLDRPHARVVTVGGTNGKGSVTAMIESIARAAGLSTGLYTSPHLLDYSERIKLNGQPVSHALLLSHFQQVEAWRGDIKLTFFEFATLTALSVFAEAAVDIMILEVGLGGRLDAVNIIDADVAVVVSVSLDHQEILGTSVEAIGAEKAGIFRAGRPALFGALARPASIDTQAQLIQAPLAVLGRDFTVTARADGRWIDVGKRAIGPLTELGLMGEHQWHNAATAVAAVAALIPSLTPQAVVEGLSRVRLRGRFECHPGSPTWVFDVAHNPGSVSSLAANVLQVRQDRRVWWIGGLLIEKDAASVAVQLLPAVKAQDVVTAVGVTGERARSAHSLRDIWQNHFAQPIAAVEELTYALEQTRQQAHADDWVVVFGSFHVVAPALNWFEQTMRTSSSG